MKRFLVLLSCFGSFAAMAEPTNSPALKTPVTNAAPQQVSGSLQARTSGRFSSAVSLNQIKPNEIVSGKTTLSGIGVEAAKMHNLLQLINPRATAEYGTPEDNLVRDPVNGRVEGLKIFAFRF